MEPKTFILLISSFAIIIGIYSIYASIKNTHKNYSHRRLKHRLIQEVLGINGARIFYGILGFGAIIFGIFMLSILYIKQEPKNENNSKTDKIFIIGRTTINNNIHATMTITTTIENLTQTIEIQGNDELNKFIKISFKNNYLNKVPNIVWKMKNLKSIDLTNNNIVDLDIDKLLKMDSLKKITLINNPINEEKIQEIKSRTKIQIITHPNDNNPHTSPLNTTKIK